MTGVDCNEALPLGLASELIVVAANKAVRECRERAMLKAIALNAPDAAGPALLPTMAALR